MTPNQMFAPGSAALGPAQLQDLEELAKALPAYLQSGGPARTLLNLSAESLEMLYAQAHAFYEQQRYSDASTLFAFLCFADHTEARFLSGMAATSQMLGRYQEAMHWLTLLLAMDLSDPVTVFRMAECMAAVGLREEALETLKIVLDLASEDEHALLRRRATAMAGLLAEQSGAPGRSDEGDASGEHRSGQPGTH